MMRRHWLALLCLGLLWLFTSGVVRPLGILETAYDHFVVGGLIVGFAARLGYELRS